MQAAYEWDNLDLPMGVESTVEMVYPTYQLSNKTKRIERADTAVWYQVKLEDGSEELIVILDGSGEILCE